MKLRVPGGALADPRAVGFAAPAVLMAMLHEAPLWENRVRWLNIAGLLDFAVAVATGVLTSNTRVGVLAEPGDQLGMGQFPLSLIPTFAVPLWILVHAISLLQLRQRAVQATAVRA